VVARWPSDRQPEVAECILCGLGILLVGQPLGIQRAHVFRALQSYREGYVDDNFEFYDDGNVAIAIVEVTLNDLD